MENRNFQELDRIFEEVGDRIEKMLSRAVNPEHNARAYETHRSHSYQKPPFGQMQSGAVPKEETTNLYGKTGNERFKGLALTVTGCVLSCSMTIGFLVSMLVKGLGFSGGAVTGSMVLMAVGLIAGLALLTNGLAALGSIRRFQRYVKAIGNNTYCSFEQLSRAAGKSLKFIKKDVRAMIHRGWFSQGHIDRQETCLITSNETYAQYEETLKQLQKRQQEEQAGKQEKPEIAPEVQELLDKGNEYLVKIQKSNAAISGREISGKISRMELIIQKIFERVREHPEIISDLKRLMNYYLPTTVKLLDAYEEMDAQPVQGENIKTSKREIEAALDTLNQAFEKLLDSVFQDTAMDVSSDISVLHTMLAQEGLTEDVFDKVKRETANKRDKE